MRQSRLIKMKLQREKKQNLIQNRQGFTLLEIIMVLVVIGILSAYVAITSIGIINTTNEQSELSQVKAHLKYAQGRAINSNSIWGIHFSGGNYALFQYTTSATFRFFPGMEKPIASPTENDCKIPMPKSLTTYTHYIWFDLWGRAYENATTLNPTGATPIAVNTKFLSDKITIEANTGYIHDT